MVDAWRPCASHGEPESSRRYGPSISDGRVALRARLRPRQSNRIPLTLWRPGPEPGRSGCCTSPGTRARWPYRCGLIAIARCAARPFDRLAAGDRLQPRPRRARPDPCHLARRTEIPRNAGIGGRASARTASPMRTRAVPRRDRRRARRAQGGRDRDDPGLHAFLHAHLQRQARGPGRSGSSMRATRPTPRRSSRARRPTSRTSMSAGTSPIRRSMASPTRWSIMATDAGSRPP